MCRPALARQLGPAPSPAGLLELPLVAIYSEAHHWDLWCESAQLVYRAKPAIVVDTLAVELKIALARRVVALVNGPFDTDLLASGQLVQPVSHSTSARQLEADLPARSPDNRASRRSWTGWCAPPASLNRRATAARQDLGAAGRRFVIDHLGGETRREHPHAAGLL